MGKNDHLLRKAIINDYNFYRDYYQNGFKCFLIFDETKQNDNADDSNLSDFFSEEDFKEMMEQDLKTFASTEYFEKLIYSSNHQCYIIQNGSSKIGYISLSKTANIWRIDEWQMDEEYQTPYWIKKVLDELLSNLKGKVIDVNLVSPMAIKIFTNLGFTNRSSIFYRKDKSNPIIIQKEKDNV